MNDARLDECFTAANALNLALAAAAEAARRHGALVNVGIVDGGGNLAAFLRMPGAFLASIDIAIDKAWTACSFGVGTAEFGAMLIGEDTVVREGLLARPRVTAIPGGLPILRNGRVDGGIGVSGSSAELDEEIARAGLNALMEI